MDIFIEKYHPEKLSFIAEGDARANIYLKLKGYNIRKEESGLDSLSGEVPYIFKLDKQEKYLESYGLFQKRYINTDFFRPGSVIREH